MDGYLTIKEFAEKAGVSYQAIAKQAKNEKSQIAPYKKVINNKIFISADALIILYGTGKEQEKIELNPDSTQLNPTQPEINPNTTRLNPIQPENTTQLNPDTTLYNPEIQPEQPKKQPENQAFIDFLLEQIAKKDEIIADKDRQIKEQSAELAQLANKLATIANNALYTTAQTHFITATSPTQEPEAEEYIAEETEQPIEEISIQQSAQPEQKTFFQKFIDLFR